MKSCPAGARCGQRRVATAFALVLWSSLSASLAGAQQTPPQSEVRVATGACVVGIVGDSLGSGALIGGLRERLASRGCVLGVSDVRHRRRSGDGVAIVQRWKKQGRLPNVVVVVLGTNDGEVGDFAVRVRQIIDLAGPTRAVVWVNTSGRGRSGEINAALALSGMRAASDYGVGILSIVDHANWATTARGAFRRDRTHMTATGYGLYAERIANEVARRVSAK